MAPSANKCLTRGGTPKQPARLAAMSMLVLALIPTLGYSQLCTRFVEIENQTGANPSGISFYFSGFAPGGADPPVLVPDEAPVCGGATIGGNLFDELSFGWPSECVDAQALLTIWFRSSDPIPSIYSGSWSDATTTYPVPLAELELSPDCNRNCIDDGLDLDNGTSVDRDQNGVPDECQSVVDIPAMSPIGAGLLALLLCASGLLFLRISRRSC